MIKVVAQPQRERQVVSLHEFLSFSILFGADSQASRRWEEDDSEALMPQKHMAMALLSRFRASARSSRWDPRSRGPHTSPRQPGTMKNSPDSVRNSFKSASCSNHNLSHIHSHDFAASGAQDAMRGAGDKLGRHLARQQKAMNFLNIE